MKAGYLALFSLVVAYSAYQGTGISSLGSASQAPKTSRDAAVVMRSQELAAGTEPFPTIGAGLCPLVLSEGHAPCGTCKAICPAKGLTGLIEDYFRAESHGDSDFAAKHWNVPEAKQSNIRFVIASLPDPVHTHMALLFDRGIESIEGAAQASGYLFSRSWMPWDNSTHNESTDFTVRMAQAHLQEQVETLPGLMIFQGSGSSGTAGTVLFVFVVGETPTAGLHAEQVQNALEIRRGILAGSRPDLPESKVLRIFGPAFSGSLMSLDSILNAQPRDRVSRIVIRSGTISSYHAVRDFSESVKTHWPDQKLENSEVVHPGRPDFATFQFSDKYQEFYLSVFFYDRHDVHSHVAILSEDETAFGNQETKPSETEVAELSRNDSSEPVVPFIRLYFPREIAQLRDAYQRDVQIQTQTSNAKAAPPSGLSLSLSVTGNDDDSVGAYSPLQTPLSQESMLQAIVATLRRKHAKVVIIRASDTLDEIFLSRYLRQNYPQARLVTVGADLLMVHDFYDPRFHGILAVTPFPLLTGADFPGLDGMSGGRKEVHRLFPDSYSVGNFNAFLSLLAFDPNAKSGELPAKDYEQLGMPSFLQPALNNSGNPLRAHLWLTSVGRDGYWPVSVLDDVSPGVLQSIQNNNPGRHIKRPELRMLAAPGPFKYGETYAVHFSVAWTIFWMLAFGLTLCMSLLLAFPSTFSRSETLGRFGGNPSSSRNGLLFLGGMLLLATETLFVIPAALWLGHYGNPAQELTLQQSWSEALNGLWLVLGGYVFSAAALGAACYRGFNSRKSKFLARTGAALCTASILIAISLTGWMWSAELDSTLGSFLYRYINVGSGVSPCLPLVMLLAGWIWWGWQSLTGVTSTQEKLSVLPSSSAFDEKSTSCSEQSLDPTNRVRLKALTAKEGQWPWEILGAVPRDIKLGLSALAGFSVILLLMRPSEIAEAFEPFGYKITYWCLLYSCLLLVCFLVTHIVALWLQLRNLLQSIERMPFRRGFKELKSLTWKPLWKLAGNGTEEFRQLLCEELEALTQIQKTGVRDCTLSAGIVTAKTATDETSAAYEKALAGSGSARLPQLRSAFQSIETSLAVVASEALLYSTALWNAGADPAEHGGRLASVERFLCLFYLNIILIPLRRLQTLILALAGVFVSVLISYSSYPFESRESFHVLLISIFFVISLVVGVVYGQMYSNPLLARITNSKPGELGLDFWVRIGTFVFVPLLSLLSVQFPEINSFLFSWLEPALQSIK